MFYFNDYRYSGEMIAIGEKIDEAAILLWENVRKIFFFTLL